MERIARAYLYFRVCLLAGEEASDVFSKCKKDGLCLFEDFDAWLKTERNSVRDLKSVPADAELMRTFRQAEVEHW